MQQQGDAQSNFGRIKLCLRQVHDSDQFIQYVCLQEACYGANRLVCRKCFRKYHFSHHFIPLRDNFNIVKSQSEQQHYKILKSIFQTNLSIADEIQIEMKKIFDMQLKSALNQLKGEVHVIGQSIFDDNLLTRTISILKYSQGKILNDQLVQKYAKIIRQISSSEQNSKKNKQDSLMRDVSQKIYNFRNLSTSLCSQLFQKLSKSLKANKFQNIQMKQQKKQNTQKVQKIQKEQAQQIKIAQNKKQKLKAKIEQKNIQRAQKQENQKQKLNNQAEAKPKDNLQIQKIAALKTEKPGKDKQKNSKISISFDNPSEKQISRKIQQLNKQKLENKELYIHSIKIKFDGIKAFIPKILLEKVPQILKDVKIIKIDMYQTFKEQLLRKVVQNFSDLQQLSITECQSFSDELIDLIILKNPNLKRFYTFFNFQQNFNQYLKSLYFKELKLENKLTMAQCMKLIKLKNLQNIHIFNCQHQRTPYIIKQMSCLKQISFGGFQIKSQGEISKYETKIMQKQTLQALQECTMLKAVSFFNVQVGTQIPTDKLFKWLKASGKNLNTLILHEFKRVTDKHIKIMGKQCEIKNLYILNSERLTGMFINDIKTLKSLFLWNAKPTQSTLSISKKQKKNIQHLIISSQSEFSSQFYDQFQNLKLVNVIPYCKNLLLIGSDTLLKMKKLQTVIVHNKVSKLMVQNVINNCPKLKRISVEQIYNHLSEKSKDIKYTQKRQKIQFNQISNCKLTHVSHCAVKSQVDFDIQDIKKLKNLMYLNMQQELIDEQSLAYFDNNNILVQANLKEQQIFYQNKTTKKNQANKKQAQGQEQEQQEDQQEYYYSFQEDDQSHEVSQVVFNIQSWDQNSCSSQDDQSDSEQ